MFCGNIPKGGYFAKSCGFPKGGWQNLSQRGVKADSQSGVAKPFPKGGTLCKLAGFPKGGMKYIPKGGYNPFPAPLPQNLSSHGKKCLYHAALAVRLALALIRIVAPLFTPFTCYVLPISFVF